MLLKSIIRWIQGYELDVKEWRKIDSFLFELKCVILTAIVVLVLLWILHLFGTFDGEPYYLHHNDH